MVESEGAVSRGGIYVDNCFGHIGVSVREVCGHRVGLYKKNGGCVYSREARRVSVPGCRVFIYPYHPILYPERLTGYVMLVFPHPVLLGPREEIELCVAGPLDIAVSSNSDLTGVIDAFPVGGVAKYAMYGTPTRGVLARWAPVKLLAKESCNQEGLDRGVVCSMLLKVRIVNSGGGAVAVRRIVYPAAAMPVFYKGCYVIGPRVEVNIQSRVSARVIVSEQALGKDWRRVGLFAPRFGKMSSAWQQGSSSGFHMLYGL